MADEGLGNGPAVPALTRARDCATARFSNRPLSDVALNGVRGTSMPAWSHLPAGELRGLVAYVKTIAPQDPPPVLGNSETTTAKNLFAAMRVCHGRDGTGNALAAPALAPPPTNFHEVQPTFDYAQATLAHGVRGTAMPKWEPKLTPDQRSLLARTFGPFMAAKTRSNTKWL